MENKEINKAQIFQDILDKMVETYKKKNADYTSGNKSAFEKSYERFGLMSSVIRLNDKVERLAAFVEKERYEVEDEKIVDTLLDVAVYAVLTLVEEKAKCLLEEDNVKQS